MKQGDKGKFSDRNQVALTSSPARLTPRGKGAIFHRSHTLIELLLMPREGERERDDFVSRSRCPRARMISISSFSSSFLGASFAAFLSRWEQKKKGGRAPCSGCDNCAMSFFILLSLLLLLVTLFFALSLAFCEKKKQTVIGLSVSKKEIKKERRGQKSVREQSSCSSLPSLLSSPHGNVRKRTISIFFIP